MPAFAGLPRGTFQTAGYDRAYFVRFGHRDFIGRAGGVRGAYVKRAQHGADAFAFRRLAHEVRAAGNPHEVSAAAADVVSPPDFSRGGERQLCDPPGHRRNPVPVSVALPGGAWVHADSIRPAHDAASAGSDEPENNDGGHSEKIRLSHRVDFQHRDPWVCSSSCLPPSAPTRRYG